MIGEREARQTWLVHGGIPDRSTWVCSGISKISETAHLHMRLSIEKGLGLKRLKRATSSRET